LDYPGHTMFGGNAQYVSRPENYWVKLPDRVDFEQAAAGSWSFPTAHRIVVDRCGVAEGDAVMITGMSGGMGNASLQWAKLNGARVIGTTRDDQKVPQLKAMGADLVVSSTDLEHAGTEIRAFTEGRGVDHYIEFTGNSKLNALPKRVLALGGTVCLAASDTADDHIPFSVMDFTRLEMQMVGIRGSRLIDQEIYLEALAAGKISVPVAREMALEEIQEAHRLMESGSLTGKIVLKPWHIAA
jgi:NADPH:quinone reductase-like Zn-dependent oxidoreductase